MQPTDFKAWLMENISRLKQEQPKFFKVWSRIHTIILLIAGIPTLLDWAQKLIPEINFQTILPDALWVKVLLRIIAACALYGKFQNNLTVRNSKQIINDHGIIIQKPSDTLPFSEKKEAIKIISS